MIGLSGTRTGAMIAFATMALNACGGVVILDGPGSTDGSGGAGGYSGVTSTSAGFPAGTGTAGTGTAGTGTAGTGTGGTSNGSTGTGPVSVTCNAYCMDIAASCAVSSTQQYPSIESCLASCKSFPAGILGDTTGNSLSCRGYYSLLARMDPLKYCSSAGPTGGDQDPSTPSGPACGDGCEAFCTLALSTCTGATNVFTDMADCLTQCKLFKRTVFPYSTADVATDDFGCRMYHLTVATRDEVSKFTHCPHITLSSAPCKG